MMKSYLHALNISTCMSIVYVIDFQEDYPFDDVYCDQGASSMGKNMGKVSMSVLS